MKKFKFIKKSKYRNRKIEIDGIKFASGKEAKRYKELKFQKEIGAIRDFKLQPKFELQPKYRFQGKTIRSINYYADFKVISNDGKIHYEDTKGVETEVFKLKKKILLYKYRDIDFRVF